MRLLLAFRIKARTSQIKISGESSTACVHRGRQNKQVLCSCFNIRHNHLENGVIGRMFLEKCYTYIF